MRSTCIRTDDIKSMTFDELKVSLEDFALQPFRIRQIYKWLHVFGVQSFDGMTDIPKDLRARLKERYSIYNAEIEKKFQSKKDGTVKYVFRLNDGELIESVLMRHNYGITICISTQVGCRMGCSFCASTLGGRIRDLTASEMLSQIHAAQRDSGLRISHIVLMGMGEPLDNYENTVRFLKLVSDPNGLNVGMRHISLSTCGLVDKIYKLMENKFQLTLSVSLHAPNTSIRSKIMPVNRKWDFEELLKACKIYAETTSRRISFEYAMIENINDSDDCARELADRLKGILCHVNLIPANEVKENSYRRSSAARLKEFQNILTERGINATVRISLGGDIDASCGQLRASVINGKDK